MSESKEITVKYETNGQELQLSSSMIKDFLVSGSAPVTDKEVMMFLTLCKYQKLNPFLNEAYMVKFQGKPAQIITGKEAFMKRANANPNYSGFKAGIIVAHGDNIKEIEGTVHLPQDKLIGGWCEVHRKDLETPIKVTLSLQEFNKGQATWKSMPATMIRKSAIVNALREAFPETLGGMYTEDDKSPQDITNEAEEKQETPKDSIAAQLEDKFKSENAVPVTDEQESEKTEVTEDDGSTEQTTEEVPTEQGELLQPRS